MSNKYLEKIASWELEKEAFVPSLSKMFSRAAPKMPKIPKTPTVTKQPTKTVTTGKIPKVDTDKLKNALMSERKNRAAQFSRTNKTSGTKAWFTLG